jgi:NAD(P)-dependent dehydrogenase (short-subunit alcohol dehydrogenase family)
MSDTRALLLGAETPAGRALAAALAAAGARLAVVAATTDAAAAFEVQRLGRRLNATAQAIDATNEMAVRVMTRQIAKRLGGLDLLAFCAGLGPATGAALALAARLAAREMLRSGGGTIVVAVTAPAGPAETPPEGVRLLVAEPPPAPDEAWARSVLDCLPPARGEPVEP